MIHLILRVYTQTGVVFYAMKSVWALGIHELGNEHGSSVQPLVS